MPKLDDPIHLDMYRDHRRHSSFLKKFLARAFKAASRISAVPEIYGYEWGDPDNCPPLAYIRDQFVLPYVDASRTALEIGPGGGRWTQYLLGFGKLYVIDYYAELLAELRKNFDRPNMTFIKNDGDDFPGVEEASIDFLFSFGTFVHLDAELIERYLANMLRILKPGGNAVIQYADKTKIMARNNVGFAENDPKRMRRLVEAAGFRIVEEDLTTLWHSSMVRFTA